MEERLLRTPMIQTDYLKIYGNVLEFKNTTLQLSNISLLSTRDVTPARFPAWSLAFICIGLLLWRYAVVFSMLAIAIGAIWIYLWYSGVQEVKQLKKLVIITNSGNTFSIVFNNQAFLDEVVNVLNAILSNPAGHGNVTINVKDNILQGDAAVVQTVNDYSWIGKV